jgi:hypothetical protein
MILSNQVRCNKCGDEPYSANRHDFQPCKCGAISVDGGMDYLRRVGDIYDYTDMSIEVADAAYKAARDDIDILVVSKGHDSVLMPFHAQIVHAMFKAFLGYGVVMKFENDRLPESYCMGEGYEEAQAAVGNAIETRRNSLGIICAIVRTYRDVAGAKFVSNEVVQ